MEWKILCGKWIIMSLITKLIWPSKVFMLRYFSLVQTWSCLEELTRFTTMNVFLLKIRFATWNNSICIIWTSLKEQLILEARYHEGIINLVMMHTNRFHMSENALDVVKIIKYLQSPFMFDMLPGLLIIWFQSPLWDLICFQGCQYLQSPLRFDLLQWLSIIFDLSSSWFVSNLFNLTSCLTYMLPELWIWLSNNFNLPPHSICC